MNILLVAGPDISLKEPYSSGIESFIVTLAHQLVNEGYTVDVIARDAELDVPFKVIDPFTDISQKTPTFWRLRVQARQFSKLDVSKYDVVHYNMFYPHLYKAGAAFHKPSLLTLHSPADSTRTRVYRKFAKRMNMQFVAISERIQEQYAEGIGQSLPIIHNGVDLRTWSVRTQKKGTYLLWSARINEQKNPHAAIMLAQHLNRPLLIAGKIADQKYFDTYVKPYLNDQIRYVGHKSQHDVHDLALHASAYLATATWQEPFGLAALEMLASGVPVVGFSTAVPPEWKHPAVSVVTSTNWQDLRGALENVRSVTPEQCRSFASNMSIENMTARYVSLYLSMMVYKEMTIEQRALMLDLHMGDTAQNSLSI